MNIIDISPTPARARLLRAQVPGNIRRAEHFCSFLRQLVTYMRERISVQAVEQESCTAFLAALQEQMSVDGTPPNPPSSPCQCSWGGASPVMASLRHPECRSILHLSSPHV